LGGIKELAKETLEGIPLLLGLLARGEFGQEGFNFLPNWFGLGYFFFWGQKREGFGGLFGRHLKGLFWGGKFGQKGKGATKRVGLLGRPFKERVSNPLTKLD